ncbi:MAG: C25 family cysteine peptidase [Planctomycetota bacterium]|nr:C25 family cysteine peptidase [Planctomycetota bacterium]
MNKRFTRNATSIVVGVVMAIGATAQARDGAEVEILKDDAEGTILRYEFVTPTLKKVHVGDGQAVIIQIGDESINAAAGEPAIADVRRSITIGPDTSVMATMISGDYIEMADVDVAPSKGPILRTINPSDVPYTFGDVYEQPTLWPVETVELGDPYIIRSQRGVVVDVNPVQYNPVTKTLRVYRNMTVMVEPVGLEGRNILTPNAQQKEGGSAFHTIYKSHFLNYSRDTRYDPIESEGELLVICHDPWMSNMQPYVDHKNGIGIATTMVSVSSVGNSPTSIMSYIENMYGGSDLVYVVLVGDIAQAASPTYSFESGKSDPSYALMTSDTYPDLIIGRFSAESAAHVDTQVERVIAFETETWTQDPYYLRGLGVASNQGPGDDNETDDQHVANIMSDLDGYGYLSTQVIADPSGSVAQGVAALNEGIGTVAYCGHGSTTAWGNGAPLSNSDVNGLTNSHMMPWIISVACVNGQFDAGTCFAEAWMRATDGGLPSGAMGIYASSVNQSWSPPMCAEDEIYDLYVSESYATFGALCYAGSCLMMDEYGESGDDMYYTWHIFADPSLCVVGTTAPPTGMQVSGNGFNAEGPNGGPFTPDTAELTVKNYDAGSLEFNAVDDVPWLDVINGSGTLGQDEEAVITVELNSAYAANMGNGFYQGAVVVTGSNGDVSVKEFDLEIGVPVAIYEFNMDTNPGWSMEAEWAYGVPTGGGGEFGNSDPNSGATGSNVCGVDLSGDYDSTVGGPWFLRTGAIDCSELTDTGLKFQRYLNSDYQPYAFATVEVSNDGVNWSMLWENGSSEVADSSWNLQEFDISSVADQQDTVYVRWGYQVGDFVWNYSGWNVDDVEIWGIAPETNPCPTDLDGDGSTGVNDVLLVIAGWGTSSGDVNGDGNTDVNDILTLLEVYGDDC